MAKSKIKIKIKRGPDTKIMKRIDGRQRNISPNMYWNENISKGLTPLQAFAKHNQVFGTTRKDLIPTGWLNRNKSTQKISTTQKSKPRITIKKRDANLKIMKRVDGKQRNISANMLYNENISKGLTPEQAFAKHRQVFGDDARLTPDAWKAHLQSSAQRGYNIATRGGSVLTSAPSSSMVAQAIASQPDITVPSIAPSAPAQESDVYREGEVVEVVSEVKGENSGLSTTAYIGIGVGAVAVLGTLVYILKK